MGCLLKMSPTQQRDLSQIHTSINKYYVTGTTTENRRGKENKKKKQAMIITRPRQDGYVVVWVRTLQSELFNYK